MELEQLKDIWNTYDQKLNQHLQVNRQILREMKLDKVKSGMRALIVMRAIEVLVFVVIIAALWKFVVNNFTISAPTLSAAVLAVFSTIGLTGSIGQIVLASTIDYSGSITRIQKQLANMKLHNLQFFRLILFSAPFYMAYIFLGARLFFKVDLYAVADPMWFWSNVVFSGMLMIVIVWFSRQMSAQHPHYRWVTNVVEEIGGKRITRGISFLREIEDFKSN